MHGVNSQTGKRLSGVARLRQSVSDILNTPIGSRVLVRDYGSRLPELLDHPRDETLRLQLIAATASALSRWEPRLSLSQVTVFFPENAAGCVIEIMGRYRADQTAITLGDIVIHGAIR